ncbi:MAG: hypothetical protein WCG92_22345, partial [Hyphomicrobiales bacterium]
LLVTHIERRYKSGPRTRDWQASGNPEILVSGYLDTLPQHVRAEIEFDPTKQEFGTAHLDSTSAERFKERTVHVPKLGISLRDEGDIVKTGLWIGVEEGPR